MKPTRSGRSVFILPAVFAALLGGGAHAVLGVCGPFTDVAADSFCQDVLQIFTLGITTGTTPTAYDPTANVNRLQMARFLSRTVDGVLKRGSRRAALQQFWTSQNDSVLGLTTVGNLPGPIQSDGSDVWVSINVDNSVAHVRGTDGKLLETWTGATSPNSVLVAMGRVFVTGGLTPGTLYRIDPSQPAGAVTTVASSLGGFPVGIAFDGSRIWTANGAGSDPPVPGSVSIVTPAATVPWTATTVTAGFSAPIGILYEGANIWVTDFTANTLLKLNPAGAVLQTVTVALNPYYPAFDGANIWVPNASSHSISVVRASSGVVLQTLTGNGLTYPVSAAFDGQRILVTNYFGGSVSLWKAADLTPLNSFATGFGTKPYGACSDGINFWITLSTVRQVARF